MVVTPIQDLAAPVTAFPSALKTTRISAARFGTPALFGTPMLIGNRDLHALRAEEKKRQPQQSKFGCLGVHKSDSGVR